MEKYVFLSLFANLALGVPVAANVLYSDGPINGHGDFYNLGLGPVADSFTLQSASTLTGVDGIGLVTFNGASPLTVEWGISMRDLGDMFLPNATLTSSFLFDYTEPCTGGSPPNPCLSVYDASFALPDIHLAAGTYYLTLQFASASNAGPVRWDQNNGPSTAFYAPFPLSPPGESIPGESFQIIGTPTGITAVPEPSTIFPLIVVLLSVFGLAGSRRWRSLPTTEIRTAETKTPH
jgi:hypothetical protein